MSVFTIIDDYEVLGVPRINLVSLAVILGIGIVLHVGLVLLARLLRAHPHKVQEETIRLLPRAKGESEC